ncbi:Uncharacterized conserved protein YecE, DUF72 family [Roseateles sp. YR242]|uniref:DUF72 domain-containing protein n=1 Tax=Roseateles sp. YR242 TaxID=1855305 RepID=UPI0008B0013F|nr:DUF72 domain-containing protein [Roseateles sp. YR242]SEK69491.1 Uncharacterized conserved protein YecE, DUF72 family [Roseateles sp. YR242]
MNTAQGSPSATTAITAPSGHAAIRVGVGGWTFEPWRQTFYPPGLAAAKELHYASRQLTAIEINGTYYSTQRAATFAKWRDDTPDGFVFSLKAHRLTTNRRVLAEAGESVQHFLHSGVAELGDKLGPIVWQFAPGKRFDPDDFGAFVALLPQELAGLRLRHVLDVRHDSFRDPAFLALARRHRAGVVFTESDDYPALPDLTADFVYTRIMRTRSELQTGVDDATLDQLAACARVWRSGGQPTGLPLIDPAHEPPAHPRDVFVFFISGAKERAPAAAQALLSRLA